MLIYNYHHFTGYQLRMTSSHLLIVLVGIHYIRNYVIRDRNQNRITSSFLSSPLPLGFTYWPPQISKKRVEYLKVLNSRAPLLSSP